VVSRTERERNFDEITFKIHTQTCVRRPCVIRCVRSNEGAVDFLWWL
jgi:hypothetical protein